MLKADGIKSFCTVEIGDEMDADALYLKFGDGRRADCVWVPLEDYDADTAELLAAMISREAVRYAGEVAGLVAAISAPRLNPTLIEDGGDA